MPRILPHNFTHPKSGTIFKVYTENYTRPLQDAINLSVVFINLLWKLLLVIQGPSAKIYPDKPGIWSIDRKSLNQLFYYRTFVSELWLVFSIAVFIYPAPDNIVTARLF